ncbi:MAG TPA: hypothetical protein PLP66_03235 [Phycisphaerae bacterium]|jgi:hypothetical protein|nr:hypothetical protein [Phycisphaerae bacterium]HQL54023.1 hypothetical protein [Phycisphaerae bacterium]
MDPNEILTLVRKRPFEPFAIRLHDGRSIEVRHPEVIVVGKRSVFVGLYHNGAEGLVDDWVLISPVAIASLHPLNAA